MQNDEALRSLEAAAKSIAIQRLALDEALRGVDGVVRKLNPAFSIDPSTGELVNSTMAEPASPQSVREAADAAREYEYEPSHDAAASAPSEPSPPPQEASEPQAEVEAPPSNGGVVAEEAEVRLNARGRRINTPPWTERIQVVESEKRKRRIFDHLVSLNSKRTYPQEIAEDLGIERHSQVSEDLRQMIERGVGIAMIPNHGRPKGQSTGRFSNAYYVSSNGPGWKDIEGGDINPLELDPQSAGAGSS